jgi:hypothetical protein
MLSNTAESSFTVTSPPSAFNSMSPSTSSVKSPLDKSISVPSIVILSTTTLFAVKTPFIVVEPVTDVLPLTDKDPVNW